MRHGSAPTTRRDPAALIDDAEAAALRRRTRAVLLALRDPSPAIARLARRLAQRLARAKARRGHVHDHIWARRRFPHPPRLVGAGLRSRALAPELRPPKAVSAVRPAARPAAPAAAARALRLP